MTTEDTALSSEQESEQNSDNQTEQPQAPQLSAIELRVIGVLMEKQLTTPDIYPLTVNSIINACNQKSSREPITHYQQGEVERTLQALCDRRLLRMERGSRANKYEQIFMQALKLGKQHQALLCVMMLRGPQTLSELHTRTQRMVEFIDKDALEHCADRLCDRETPYAIRLGQQPGQRGERIAHLFSGTPTVYAQATQTRPLDTENSNVEQRYSAVNTIADNTELKDDIELLKLELADVQSLLSTLKAESIEQKKIIAELLQLAGKSVAHCE